MGVLCLFLVSLCSALCPFLFCNQLNGENDMVALLCLPGVVLLTAFVLWLVLAVEWVSLQCVIVVFLDHTHLHFGQIVK